MQVSDRRGGATGNPQRLLHGKGSILGVAIACATDQRRRTSQWLERRLDQIHQQTRLIGQRPGNIDQVAISLWGRPSLVTWPLNSLAAICLGDCPLGCHAAR